MTYLVPLYLFPSRAELLLFGQDVFKTDAIRCDAKRFFCILLMKLESFYFYAAT